MVTNSTKTTRRGVYDWLAQRISALILAAWFLFMLGYLLLNPELDYAQWQGLFASTWMRIFTLVSLVALCAHGWVGMWIVATDYLTTELLGPKGTTLRFLLLGATAVLLLVYLVWGALILWGN